MYELRPHATMGATITGLDVSKEYDQATKERLYKDWLDYGVLVFRAPGVTAEQHLRLSEVFGELWQHPIVSVRTKDNPNLVQLPDKEMAAPIFMKDGQMWFGYIFWHQDTAYTTNICKGSMLRMEVPATEGGETAFCDIAKAYDALPESTKRRIEGLEVRMTLHFNPAKIRFGTEHLKVRYTTPDEAKFNYPETPDFVPVIHPLVAVHPESGRKTMNISPAMIDWIVGMDRAESDALLNELVDHVLQPQFIYTHTYEQGDMALWDNRRVLHHALGYPYGVQRTAFRTTLTGGVESGRYDESEQPALVDA